ncbi:hypothetical protein UY3_06681 [Chelonia mydas]|uniref:Uncharacterized protein n=1 Tax=Chelonia mydas TaxID=8469 RepID=M7BG24_CHEMY|nr:hypothetical protein UY3_06681 [Chelonia mydas]
MPKEHMNRYKLFKQKARIRMGLTPEHAHRQFRALRWKPDMAFSRHAYYTVKNWDAWISGANVKSLEDLSLLIQMEQFLKGVPKKIERYILNGKPKTVIEAGEIGAKWVEVAEKKKARSSWWEYKKGQPDTPPSRSTQGPTSQGEALHTARETPDALSSNHPTLQPPTSPQPTVSWAML